MAHIPITRQEFETWLYELCPIAQTVGSERFVVPLSNLVGLELRTPFDSLPKGTDDRLKLTLVDLVRYVTLPQIAFARRACRRTATWRNDWSKQFDIVCDEFVANREECDRFTNANQTLYGQTWKEHIESVEAWGSIRLLVNLHECLARGEWLTPKQEDAILRFKSKGAPVPPPTASTPPGNPAEAALLSAVEKLVDLSSAKPDSWTFDFSKNILSRLRSGKPLSARQEEVLRNKLARYGVPLASAAPVAPGISMP